MFNEVNIPASPSIDILVVTLNANLSGTSRVLSIAKTGSRKQGPVYRVRKFFTDDHLAILYKSCPFPVGIQLTFVEWMWSGGTEIVG